MPLISPILAARLRDHWQPVLASLVLALFVLVHVTVFEPAASRYQTALKRARELGLSLDPEKPAQMIPPRVLALLTGNSLPASAAAMQRETGVLTATLLDDLTQLTNQHGMQTLTAEPGAMSTEDKAVQVRAHLKLQGSFADFAGLLDDMSRSEKLISVDRFTIASATAGYRTVDLWVTRYILKQTPRKGA